MPSNTYSTITLRRRGAPPERGAPTVAQASGGRPPSARAACAVHRRQRATTTRARAPAPRRRRRRRGAAPRRRQRWARRSRRSPWSARTQSRRPSQRTSTARRTTAACRCAKLIPINTRLESGGALVGGCDGARAAKPAPESVVERQSCGTNPSCGGAEAGATTGADRARRRTVACAPYAKADGLAALATDDGARGGRLRDLWRCDEAEQHFARARQRRGERGRRRRTPRARRAPPARRWRRPTRGRLKLRRRGP